MLQDDFLDKLRDNKSDISIFLISGIQLTGTLHDYDNYTLILKGAGGLLQLIYKQQVATIQPQDTYNEKQKRRNRLYR